MNKELVGLYWDIGRMISVKQKELGWGKGVVEKIAHDLRLEFPKQKGFSTRNLWLMVSFYTEYEHDEFLQTLSAEISFSNNMLILATCRDRSQRIFYLKFANKFGWSYRILQDQLRAKTFEKYLLNQTSFENLPSEKSDQLRSLAIKDHYTFDFLEIPDHHSEKELEHGLERNMQKFLLEMGGDFSFMGSQYRIQVGSQEFFIDLLLFHRRLQCLIVVELKTGAFKPEYKGKLEFYLNVLNDTHRLPHENEPVGIIICKTKDRLVVEYSLKKSLNSIGIASYSTGPELPEYYEQILPSLEQIENGLRIIEG